MRKVCLITGASAGIGAACARLASAQGYDLVLTYNTDRAGVDQVAADAQANGAEVAICQADVADPEQVAQLYERIDERFGVIDCLINNAGIVAPATNVTGLTHDRLRRIFDVNVIGAILVAKEAVSRMLAQGSAGGIVNISSTAARLGSAGLYVDYAATKAALDTFTKGLSDEVAAQGIRVNSVRPGIIETDIHAKGGEPDRPARLALKVPMQRSGQVQEVANAVLWLLSDEASFVTGTTLDVSGGR